MQGRILPEEVENWKVGQGINKSFRTEKKVSVTMLDEYREGKLGDREEWSKIVHSLTLHEPDR